MTEIRRICRSAEYRVAVQAALVQRAYAILDVLPALHQTSLVFPERTQTISLHQVNQ